MTCEVTRLKNAPKGEPYAIERVGNLTPDAASERASAWWESRGTLAVVILIAGKEDVRYEHEYMDPKRVPEDWGKAPAKGPVPPSPALKIPAPPRAPPTLANVQERQKRAPCLGCGRRTKAGTPASPTDAARCAICGAPYTCATCGTVLPFDRKYEGDDDPTPSGRLNNRRCPGCGIGMPNHSRRQIYQIYTRKKR